MSQFGRIRSSGTSTSSAPHPTHRKFEESIWSLIPTHPDSGVSTLVMTLVGANGDADVS